MQHSLSPNERFLVDFHDQRAGATSQAYMSLPASKQNEIAASTYDFLASLIPKETSPLTVLDLACGDGYLLYLIAAARQQPTSLIGLDISPGELAAAGKRLGTSATLIQGRSQAIPLPNASTDFVLCHMALMLMDELDTVIAEIRRVLKPGGVFSFIVGAKSAMTISLTLYLERLFAAQQRLNTSVPRLGDRRLIDPEQIQQILAASFTDVVIEDISITRRYTPTEMWAWFDSMYDMHGIPAQEQAQMRQDYIEALTPMCEADGCLEFTDKLRQVRGMAA